MSNIPETNRPAAVQALEYVKLEQGAPLEGTPIQWAFVGSCQQSHRGSADRIVAAQRQKGSIRSHLLCCSLRLRSGQGTGDSGGLDVIIREAGADFRMPGCSMCLGMNDDKVPAGMRCVSSSNRNFVGRQGPGSITHLASSTHSTMITASALAGKRPVPGLLILLKGFPNGKVY